MVTRLTPKKPIATGFGFLEGDSITFNTPTKEVSLGGCGKDAVRIIRHCNGQKDIVEVQTLSGLSAERFAEVVEALVQNDVLIDSREYGTLYNELAMFPPIASYNLGPDAIRKLHKQSVAMCGNERGIPLGRGEGQVVNLTRLRKSVRAFKPISLSADALAGLLQVMYSRNEGNVVPSAGGLYTLQLHVLLMRNVGDLSVGYYRYNPSTHSLTKTAKMPTQDGLSLLLDSVLIGKNATAVVFVTCDMSISAKKYANRANRYACIEAGHVSQNAYLYCAEKEIGIVSCGGFSDALVARFLGLKYPVETALLALVVGTPDCNANKRFVEPYVDAGWHLRETLLGVGKPVEKLNYRTYHIGCYTMPRFVAFTKYYDAEEMTKPKSRNNGAKGTGLSISEATVKAIAEGFERHVCGVVRIDKKCSEKELGAPVIDLCSKSPLHPTYQARVKLEVRKPDGTIEWVAGKYMSTGETIYSPIDQIFYPLRKSTLGRNLSYFASSTGVAAHSSIEIAKEKGLLELIERDAIAVMWYAKREPSKISRDVWPQDVCDRVDGFESLDGKKVTFCNLTLENVPVVMCVIQSESYPHFVTGSGANWTYEEALRKALDEAEIMHHSLRSLPSRKRLITQEKVVGVQDHAIFWAQKSARGDITWLLSGKEVNPEIPHVSAKDLIRSYNPVVFDLTLKDNPSGLHVVRIVSEALMPILFGYGAEHYRHHRLDGLGLDWAWGYPSLPHCLA